MLKCFHSINKTKAGIKKYVKKDESYQVIKTINLNDGMGGVADLYWLETGEDMDPIRNNESLIKI